MMNPVALHRSFQGRTDLGLLRPARVRSGRLFIAVVALGSSAANAQDMTAGARLFAGKCQRNADMHGGGRFAGTALFIGEHDHMSSHDCPLFWLALRFCIAHSAASLSTPLGGAPW
jgi:hypothetical protein